MNEIVNDRENDFQVGLIDAMRSDASLIHNALSHSSDRCIGSGID